VTEVTDAQVKAAMDAMHESLKSRPHTSEVWKEAIRAAIMAAIAQVDP